MKIPLSQQLENFRTNHIGLWSGASNELLKEVIVKLREVERDAPVVTYARKKEKK